MNPGWIGILAAVLFFTSAAPALADEALARKSGCFECHSVDKKVIGPPFRDVAAKYRHDSRARADLFDKVRDGGKGNGTQMTGGVPMPPFSGRLTATEIEQLVAWILGR